MNDKLQRYCSAATPTKVLVVDISTSVQVLHVPTSRWTVPNLVLASTGNNDGLLQVTGVAG